MITILNGNRAVLATRQFGRPRRRPYRLFSPVFISVITFDNITYYVTVDWQLQNGDFFEYCYLGGSQLAMEYAQGLLEVNPPSSAFTPLGGIYYNPSVRPVLFAKLGPF